MDIFLKCLDKKQSQNKLYVYGDFCLCVCEKLKYRMYKNKYIRDWVGHSNACKISDSHHKMDVSYETKNKWFVKMKGKQIVYIYMLWCRDTFWLTHSMIVLVPLEVRFTSNGAEPWLAWFVTLFVKLHFKICSFRHVTSCFKLDSYTIDVRCPIKSSSHKTWKLFHHLNCFFFSSPTSVNIKK